MTTPMTTLTDREWALLRGFAAGRTRSQIARELRVAGNRPIVRVVELTDAGRAAIGDDP